MYRNPLLCKCVEKHPDDFSVRACDASVSTTVRSCFPPARGKERCGWTSQRGVSLCVVPRSQCGQTNSCFLRLRQDEPENDRELVTHNGWAHARTPPTPPSEYTRARTTHTARARSQGPPTQTRTHTHQHTRKHIHRHTHTHIHTTPPTHTHRKIDRVSEKLLAPPVPITCITFQGKLAHLSQFLTTALRLQVSSLLGRCRRRICRA